MSNVSMENAEKVIRLMEEAVDALMLPHFGKVTNSQIMTKLDKSIVTEIDLAVEKFLTEKLIEMFPGSFVLGEEAVEADKGTLKLFESGKPLWVIDPLDGTRLFSEGRTGWGILVAYMEGGETKMSFILDGMNKNKIVVVKGKGIFINGNKADKNTNTKSLQEQIGMVWYSEFQDDVTQIMHDNIHSFKEMKSVCSCSVELAFLMLNREIDFASCANNKSWDVMSLILMLDEMGGASRVVRNGEDYTGTQPDKFSEAVLFINDVNNWQETKEKQYAGISQQRLEQGISAY